MIDFQQLAQHIYNYFDISHQEYAANILHVLDVGAETHCSCNSS